MQQNKPSNNATAIAEDPKWNDAVARITELTREGKIKWDSVDPDDAQISSPYEVYAAYDSRYSGKIVRFLEVAVQSAGFTSSKSSTVLELLGGSYSLPKSDEKVWRRRNTVYSLVLVDVTGVPLFSFPRSVELVELLTAIKQQRADVDGFLNALFAEA